MAGFHRHLAVCVLACSSVICPRAAYNALCVRWVFPGGWITLKQGCGLRFGEQYAPGHTTLESAPYRPFSCFGGSPILMMNTRFLHMLALIWMLPGGPVIMKRGEHVLPPCYIVNLLVWLHLAVGAWAFDIFFDRKSVASTRFRCPRFALAHLCVGRGMQGDSWAIRHSITHIERTIDLFSLSITAINLTCAHIHSTYLPNWSFPNLPLFLRRRWRSWARS